MHKFRYVDGYIVADFFDCNLIIDNDYDYSYSFDNTETIKYYENQKEKKIRLKKMDDLKTKNNFEKYNCTINYNEFKISGILGKDFLSKHSFVIYSNHCIEFISVKAFLERIKLYDYESRNELDCELSKNNLIGIIKRDEEEIKLSFVLKKLQNIIRENKCDNYYNNVNWKYNINFNRVSEYNSEYDKLKKNKCDGIISIINSITDRFIFDSYIFFDYENKKIYLN